jgi:molybdate transport system ATP-binding protein
MSSSEQRLVLIARALVKHPRILILDELCQGLDGAARQHILGFLDRLASDGDVTLIVVAHRAKDLPQCITNVLHLADGRASIWPDVQNLPKDL